jgi:hypothetical protein
VRTLSSQSLYKVIHRKEVKMEEGNMRIQSVSELAVKVAQDPKFAARIKKAPAATIASVAAPLESDVWIYRMVVAALGLAVLVGVIGAIVLAVLGKTVPEVLVALGSAAVGALAGLLAPSPASRQ